MKDETLLCIDIPGIVVRPEPMGRGWECHVEGESASHARGESADEAVGLLIRRLAVEHEGANWRREQAKAKRDDGFREPEEFMYSGTDRSLAEATAQATANLRQSSLKVWRLGERFGITEWGADLSADGGIVVCQALPVEALRREFR